MIDGFLFNRAFFHATPSAISCICWINQKSDKKDLTLKAFDIVDNEAKYIKDIAVHKVFNTSSAFFDKRKNDDYIAYMNCSGFNLDATSRGLVRTNNIKGHGSCFYVYPDNYLHKLPLFCSKLYPQEAWYEKDVYYTTSDGGDSYTHDELFLKRCLIYTVLSNQNKCLSFTGSDGRYYRNELTLDDTSGDTCASADLAKLFAKYPPDCDEQELINLWNNVMEEAKKTVGYDSSLTYGVYQITKELNTSYKEGSGRNKRTIYDYPVLNGYLVALRDRLKAYYKSHITDLMFKYELLK